jgi:D-cysteine desulfhydrase
MWIKRDDATAGAEAGNKIRKLEFLFADALAKGKKTILTCGGLQSNHARATALVSAELGLSCILFLRVLDPDRAKSEPLPLTGNVLLDRLAGAEIRLISPEEYRNRAALMDRAARDVDAAYVIPEGGSNGLGSLGYVEAMREVREQDARVFDVVAHACGSGGTAAGVALGAKRFDVAKKAWAFAVCDDRSYFEKTIARIAGEARALDPTLPDLDRLVVDDRAKGPGYAFMSREQKEFLALVARRTGLVLDPVYTGKALYGVKQAIARGDIAKGAEILFLHTGGLPGLLAQGDDLAEVLP